MRYDIDSFKVDFIGVGAPKCGTEWLAGCLREHPEIDFSKHKEINFFLSFLNNGFMQFVYENMRINNWKDYVNEFSWKTDQIKGEFSNHYLFDGFALKQIKKKFPKVKIVIALRDPVEYLNSIYWYMKHSNVYHLMPDSFEDAVENSNKNELFNKGHAYFYKYVKNCFDIFGKRNVYVVLLDDIKINPETVMKGLYEFIGVDSGFKPKLLYKHVNKTKQVRFPELMLAVNLLMKMLTRVGLGKFLNYLMNTDTPIRFLYKRLMHVSKGYPALDKKIEIRLKTEFREDILRLELLLNRDLSKWK